MHTIITTDWKTHSRQLSAIRTDVFVKEQQVPTEDEWDGLDETAIHFLVQDEHQSIGCARLLIDELNYQKHFHIGRVAILKPFRGAGIGQLLMKFVLSYCAKRAPYPVYLHAQIERRAFYERLGFIAQGDEFMDAGIPHITMYWQSQPIGN
ncbi:MAG: GNAT family N-acetyltransferase [Cellvibrio sp. 79]|nr:MAG: GNAT family N-acetyltransferase [Cellvibrio sp. 79]